MATNPRVEDLKRRVQQDPASIAFAALAEEYRRAGLYWEAIEACRAGLQRHPSYLSARVTLGRALLEVGEVEEGREHLEQVLKVAPENLAAIRALAEAHRRRADLHNAEAAGEPSQSDIPPSAEAPATNAAVPAIQAAMPTAASASAVIDRPAVVADDLGTLARLEAFLGAIARARETLHTGGHVSLSR
jgi:tetratricopeptide (TPR) repeat protein